MPKIVITDLPKNALVHSVKIKRWLTEYQKAIKAACLVPDNMPLAVKRKIADIQMVIDTIDDKPTDDPF